MNFLNNVWGGNEEEKEKLIKEEETGKLRALRTQYIKERQLNSRLCTRRCPALNKAATLVGTSNVLGMNKLIPIVLIPDRELKLHIIIPEGFHAMITRMDAFIGIWPPGCYMVPPWIRVSHLVTRQYITFDTPVKEVPTKDDVMVEVDVSVVFRIKPNLLDVTSFVYNLGPERLEKMLKAYQEEAVRRMARMLVHSSINNLISPQYKDTGSKRRRVEINDTAVPIFNNENNFSYCQIRILKGEELEGMNADGSSDPYLVLTLDMPHKEQFTTTKPEIKSNATWNEDFTFQIRDGSQYLKMTMWDNQLIGQHQFMGYVLIPLAIMKEESQIHRCPILEGPKGRGYLTVRSKLLNQREDEKMESPVAQRMESWVTSEGPDRSPLSPSDLRTYAAATQRQASDEEPAAAGEEGKQKKGKKRKGYNGLPEAGVEMTELEEEMSGEEDESGSGNVAAPAAPLSAPFPEPAAEEADGNAAKNEDDIWETVKHLEQTKNLMNEQLGRYGVEICRLAVTNVHVPEHIWMKMEGTTLWDARNKLAAADQSFAMMQIRDEGNWKKLLQSSREAKAQKIADAQRELAHHRKVNAQYEAETQRMVSKAREKVAAEVRKIEAETALKAAQLQKQRDLDIARVRAEITAKVTELEVKKAGEIMRAKAEAAQNVAQNKAKAIEFRVAAEEKARVQLAAKREFDEHMRQLEVLEQLATNEKVVLSGSNKDSTMAQLMAAKNSSVLLGLTDK